MMSASPLPPQVLTSTHWDFQKFYFLARLKRAAILAGVTVGVAGVSSELILRVIEAVLSSQREVVVAAAQNLIAQQGGQPGQNPQINKVLVDMAHAAMRFRDQPTFGHLLVQFFLDQVLHVRRDSFLRDFIRYNVFPNLVGDAASFAAFGVLGHYASPYLRLVMSDNFRKDVAACSSASPSFVRAPINGVPQPASTLNGLMEQEAAVAAMWFPRLAPAVYALSPLHQPCARILPRNEEHQTLVRKMYYEDATVGDVAALRATWETASHLAVEASEILRFVCRKLVPRDSQQPEQQQGVVSFVRSRLSFTATLKFVLRQVVIIALTILLSHQKTGVRFKPYAASWMSAWIVGPMLNRFLGLSASP